MTRALALAVAAAAALGVTTAAPLGRTAAGGVPLTGTTGLQIIAANNPPLVIDENGGRVGRVSGLDVRGNPVLTVLGAGDAAVVWLENEWQRRDRRALSAVSAPVHRRSAL